jgi:hypothetical protein
MTKTRKIRLAIHAGEKEQNVMQTGFGKKKNRL